MLWILCRPLLNFATSLIFATLYSREVVPLHGNNLVLLNKQIPLLFTSLTSACAISAGAALIAYFAKSGLNGVLRERNVEKTPVIAR